MRQFINSSIYLCFVLITGYLFLEYFPHDNNSLIVFLLITVIMQYVLLSPFSSSTVRSRLILTVIFCFIGSSLGLLTLAYVAFHKTHSSLEFLAPVASPGIIIALHLLWTSIWDLI